MKRILLFLIAWPLLTNAQPTPPANATLTVNATTGAIVAPVSAATFKSANSIGPGFGSVTSVSVTTANGVSGTVATATTTPAITLSLAAITPNTVNGITMSGSGSVANSGTTALTAFTGSGVTSGTNTGDQTSVSGNAGTATILATGRTIGITGDLTYTSPSFNGSGNVTAAGVLATVNSNVGSFGSVTAAPVVTVNAKGLVTAASTATITPAIGSVTGLGTGVATALGVNVGSAGAPVVNGGALGTPSSGVATNLTGTASGLTAGNVTTNANLTGDVTSSGNATTLTNAPVIAKVLTGYTSGAGTVASTDSILQAFQKLNGNAALALPLTGGTMSGNIVFSDTGEGVSLHGSGTVTGASGAVTVATASNGLLNLSPNGTGYVSISASANLSVEGALRITNGTMPLVLERSGMTTDNMFTTFRAYSTKTTAPGDGFGSGIIFGIIDNTGTRSNLGQIGAVVSGTSDTGDISFRNYISGINTEKLRLLSGGGLKFFSGTLLASPQAGVIEFLTDKSYFTITTGSSRKEITLNDAALTSGTIPVATTNGRLTDSGLSTASLTSSTYTPSATNVTNITSSTPNNATYTRVGSVVTVFGTITVTNTLAVASEVDVSLPVASNLSASTDLNGTATMDSTTSVNMYIKGDATNDRASIYFTSAGVGQTSTIYFTFQYRVI